MLLFRWRVNLLALEDETAASLGTVPPRERGLLLLSAVAATSSVTTVSGIIGWLGLIVPHLARRLAGADAGFNLPTGMLVGGVFTLICDDVARSLLPGEIPLGILTSLLGAATFILLITTGRSRPKP